LTDWGGLAVLLLGGAHHAGAATLWWSDCNAARRPTPEYYDSEGTTGTQFQLIASKRTVPLLSVETVY